MTTYNYIDGIPESIYYDGSEIIKEIDYNPAKKIEKIAYGNNAETGNVYDYDTGYRLSRKGLVYGGQQYGLTDYIFDSLGNIISFSENGTVSELQKDVSYSYDNLSRLTSADY